ncbi:mevalonate kinase-like [Tropilaelaps mercedesae]|uniref:Mevalonate kinase n=1 Tax=Tropilaelaps mercedesae TaxID=418985 RepID=A0A1V9Y074_9ACAR|nr:mevalonate kinase-like [Tropilaelaps mercedesae]
MEFKVSVPGKVILHGEHSVVYGKAAVASAIGLRTEAHVRPCSEENVVLELKDFGKKFTWKFEQFHPLESWNYGTDDVVKPSDDLLNLLRNTFDIQPETKWQGSLTTFLFLYNSIAHHLRPIGKRFIPVEISISSALPIGAGLGSSAAYSVAVAASLLRVYNKIAKKEGVASKEDLEIISNWAFQSEVILHGKPSGIDNSICSHGGALLFQRGQIQEINSSVPLYRVLLVNTGVSRKTRALVGRVRQRVELHPTIMAHIFDAMDVIAKDTWQKLKQHSTTPSVAAEPVVTRTNKQLYEFAAEMISINHHLLNSIGVGHPALDRIITAAGAGSTKLSAKLTGAGGGGCGFVLLGVGEPDTVEEIISLKEELEKEGFECWLVDIGCPGVTFS